MNKKQKLELTWIGKENRPKLEPRILLEDPEKSYHAAFKNSPRPLGEGAGVREDIFDNRLIFGDNLLALKALEQEFAGKVKCVFIDPPYNTGSAFEHYDDALEHSTWLGLMRDRLEVIRRLLSPTGFICCHIDDTEGHYLKVLMDEVFGRSNYLVTMYDRLNIVAHDKFQEIIDEANRAGSVIRLQQVILDPEKDFKKTTTVVAQSTLEQRLGLGRPAPQLPTEPGVQPAPVVKPAFATEIDNKVAQIVYQVIQEHEHLPSSRELAQEDVAAYIVKRVEEELAPRQLELEGLTEKPDVSAIVARTTEIVVQQTIDIPRIIVLPKGEVSLGFHPFTLDAASINYQPVSRDLLIKHLRTHKEEFLGSAGGIERESRLEDYLVRALIDFNDISYDAHADLLYDLSGQVVRHFRERLNRAEDETRNILQYYQKQLVEFIHAQMQAHQWEKVVEYDVVVSKGFTALKQTAFTAAEGAVRDFRQTVEDKGKIAQLVFVGFQRCLYTEQKFQSDTERKFAIILDRDSQKWFKPAKGQFQIFYQCGKDHLEYQPDFVAETADSIYMIETKARGDMTDGEVLAKKAAAITWCGHATDHAVKNRGKSWKYLLIPHDVVAENMSLKGISEGYCCR